MTESAEVPAPQERPPKEPAPQEPAPKEPAPQEPAPKEPAPKEPAPQEPARVPPRQPVIRRQTARVLPVDDDGRVLLLHGWDPHRPEHPFWFTVGGAAESGESLRDAAVRELYEETRISVDPRGLGEPIAESAIEFSWGGHHIAQDQTFYAVAAGTAEVSLEGLDHWEQATTDKYGWLWADDLEADEVPAHPDLPDLIRKAVASVRGRPR